MWRNGMGPRSRRLSRRWRNSHGLPNRRAITRVSPAEPPRAPDCEDHQRRRRGVRDRDRRQCRRRPPARHTRLPTLRRITIDATIGTRAQIGQLSHPAVLKAGPGRDQHPSMGTGGSCEPGVVPGAVTTGQLLSAQAGHLWGIERCAAVLTSPGPAGPRSPQRRPDQRDHLVQAPDSPAAQRDGGISVTGYLAGGVVGGGDLVDVGAEPVDRVARREQLTQQGMQRLVLGARDRQPSRRELRPMPPPRRTRPPSARTTLRLPGSRAARGRCSGR